MMMNLFLIFDPSSSEDYSLNWLFSMLLIFYIPLFYWFVPSRYNYIYLKLMNYMFFEIKILLNLNKFNLLIYISLMFFILFNNFLGLFSYIFTCSSHLVFTFSISLPLWISMMMYGWSNNMNKMFAHLVPLGTPFVLMFFMVIIETISNLIRPLTLAVRLSANMIAGHLLLTLMGEMGQNLMFLLLPLLLFFQILLMLLEMSVSFIQSYVFVILSTLYSQEFFYDHFF